MRHCTCVNVLHSLFYSLSNVSRSASFFKLHHSLCRWSGFVTWAIFKNIIMITTGITGIASTCILWTNIIFRIPLRITSRNLSVSCRRRIRTIKISLRWRSPIQIIWWRIRWRLLFINFIKNNSSVFPFYIHMINFTVILHFPYELNSFIDGVRLKKM